MFNITEKTIVWGGKELSLQTGKIARQADGAVIARLGGTQVLATVVFGKKANSALDFFPLTVNYQDKYYAVGKIPGGFFKREGRPTEREILISRLIDRPVRPLFDERFRNEVQVVVSVITYDDENSTDIVSLIGASAALAISGVPMMDIVGAAKVGFINNSYVLNPTAQELVNSSLELVVAGTKQGVLMVESEAKELNEEQMLGAVKFAHQSFAEVITLIEDFKVSVNKTPHEFATLDSDELKLFATTIAELSEAKLRLAFAEKDKTLRSSMINAVKVSTEESLQSDDRFPEELVARNFNYYFKNLEKDIVRGDVLNKKVRIDGRTLEQVRPIVAEVDCFNRVHGSSIFTRGETQAMVFATLGTDADSQIIDDIEGDTREDFMLHYNFPPFSVGEVGRIGSPGRREIGHGKLAWRAIHPLLPSKELFPYSIRVVSEITESNGSSSMATVCGASLALMSAGVPMPRPIAGIAMGLIKEKDSYAVLSDILGDEDHLGDMDFKVAGTDQGITALQMDIKITSITYDIMEQALSQAHKGRLHIIGEMNKAMSEPKAELSKWAPKIHTLQVNKDKIKDIIGSGGKVIKEICANNDVKVDISDDGLVKVSGINIDGIEAALKTIKSIVAVPEIDKIYDGTVVKVLEFGAFINFLGKNDGFLHISEVTPNKESNIHDFIKEGETLQVKVVNIDEKGKIRLTKKI